MLLKITAWSQLSVVVSVMGMLRPPLPTSVWFLSLSLQLGAHAGLRIESRKLLVASIPLYSYCDKHAIYFLITLFLIYHVLKKTRLMAPRTRAVICLINRQLKPETAGKMAQVTLKRECQHGPKYTATAWRSLFVYRRRQSAHPWLEFNYQYKHIPIGVYTITIFWPITNQWV